MPPSAAVIARAQRILAGHAAGAPLLDLAVAEEVEPAVVRRVLRRAGIAPGPTCPPNSNPNADRAAPPACLADPAWLRAEYATKGAKRIAKELGCSHALVYEASHAAGIPPRANGHYPKAVDQVTPELAGRIVALYLAGGSVKVIAAEFGLPVPAVSHGVEEQGVKRSRSAAALAGAHRRATFTQPPGEWPAELAAEVLDRYGAGESGATIAESLGLAPSSVYGVLDECEVLRSHKEASRAHRESGSQPATSGKVSGSLPAQAVEQAIARYLAGDSPRLIAS